MYSKINMPNGLNSGSCKALVAYLDKEEKGFFFDKNNEKASKERVQKEIDNNVFKLTKTEDKFYMISLQPYPNWRGYFEYFDKEPISRASYKSEYQY